NFLILTFITMMARSMGRTTESYYTISTTARYPIYSDQTTYRTDTSPRWFSLHSRSTSYPTQSSTYPYPRYTTTYRTNTSPRWSSLHPRTTNYPTQSSTYPYPWYTTTYRTNT